MDVGFVQGLIFCINAIVEVALVVTGSCMVKRSAALFILQIDRGTAIDEFFRTERPPRSTGKMKCSSW